LWLQSPGEGLAGPTLAIAEHYREHSTVAVSLKRSPMPPHTLIIWSDVGAGSTAKAFSRTRIGSGASGPSHKGSVVSSSLTCSSSPLLFTSWPRLFTSNEDARARANTTSTLVAATSWRKLGQPNACDSDGLSAASMWLRRYGGARELLGVGQEGSRPTLNQPAIRVLWKRHSTSLMLACG
jgi:hypothetical protein